MKYYLWQVSWTKKQIWILFVADYVVYDAIFGRFYGLRYYVWQIQWSKILFVADFLDKLLFLLEFTDIDGPIMEFLDISFK